MHPRIRSVLTENNTSHELWPGDQATGIKSLDVFAAAADRPSDRITKTLFLQATSKSRPEVLCLVVAPVSKRRVDLERVAKHVDVARLRMAPLDVIKQQLDYEPQGISPLACGHIPIIMDSCLMAHSTIWIGSGVAEVQIEISPADLVELTGATEMDLTMPEPDPNEQGEPNSRG